ncbi:hypothetical protein EB796_018516 [Bugula neritina]|uniref:Uncharacterized protein n=1 Tax=Bugula neritina TaxID=10212 RepID=A0A7J7JB72_BUGNE|nr:hypothetical protein EB796_018516 [Bugula neritina]
MIIMIIIMPTTVTLRQINASQEKRQTKKKTELSKTGEPAFRVCASYLNYLILFFPIRFLKAYELLCQQEGCLPMPYIKSALKQAIEDEKFLTKMIVEPVPVNSSDDPTVKLEPLLNAMRRERYNYIKGLYVWELPMTNEEITALVSS